METPIAKGVRRAIGSRILRLLKSGEGSDESFIFSVCLEPVGQARGSWYRSTRPILQFRELSVHREPNGKTDREVMLYPDQEHHRYTHCYPCPRTNQKPNPQ